MATNIDFLKLVHIAFSDHVVNYFSFDEHTFTHYTSVDGFLNIIKESEIWFSNISDVNDITEFEYGLQEVILPCINDYKFNDTTLNQKLLEAIKEIQGRNFSFLYEDKIKYSPASIFLFCCSKTENSTLLWNLYSKNTNRDGFSITFDIKDLHDSLLNKAETDKNKSNAPHSHYLVSGKIIYDLNEQKKVVRDYLDCLEFNLNKSENEETKNYILRIFVEKLFIMTLLMKSSDFCNENEIRFILIMDDEGLSVPQKGEERNSNLIFRNVGGFISSKISFKFDRDTIKHIHISPFSKQDNIMPTSKYFLKKYGLKEIEIIHTEPKMR